MPNVHNDDEETLWFADESEYMEEDEEEDITEPAGRSETIVHDCGGAADCACM